MIHFHRLSILILLHSFLLFPASHKSLINKYAFSDDYLDSLCEIVLSKRAHFYSLPNSVDLPNTPFFIYNNDDQKITADLYTILSYENYREKSYPNTFLGSILSYKSHFLKGEIQFDFHSTNRHSSMDLVDSLNDVAFEQIVSNYDHISGTGKNKDFNFQMGYIEFYYKNFSLLSGKYPLRWGPGHKGTLGLSGTTYSPFFYYLLQIDFGKIIHAAAFLNGLDDDWLFVKDTVPNADRFSAGQRLDFKIGKYVQIGIYELVNFNGTTLLSRYANPIQLYYISNHIASGVVIEKRNNIMGGIDFNICAGPFRFYGDFLNDDITVFEKIGTPNKFGFQVGSAFYGSGILQETGVEYTHLSYGTYSHWLPGLNRHTYYGESRGWPWGNDMDLWHLRARFKFPKNTRLHAEVNWWIKDEGKLTEFYLDLPPDGRPNLKTKGNIVDYNNGDHMVSFQIGALWKPVSWVEYEMMWLPSVFKGKFENRVRAAAVVWLPTKLRREINVLMQP